jgi:hypothetical protein
LLDGERAPRRIESPHTMQQPPRDAPQLTRWLSEATYGTEARYLRSIHNIYTDLQNKLCFLFTLTWRPQFYHTCQQRTGENMGQMTHATSSDAVYA